MTKHDAIVATAGIAIGVVGTYAVTFGRLGKAILDHRRHYNSVMALHAELWEYLENAPDDIDPEELSRTIITKLEFIRQMSVYG